MKLFCTITQLAAASGLTAIIMNECGMDDLKLMFACFFVWVLYAPIAVILSDKVIGIK